MPESNFKNGSELYNRLAQRICISHGLSNGIIEINSKPKTYAQCIQNTIMLHTPNSTPAPHPLQLAIYQLFVTTLPFL
jgi:hypothetical protein